MRREIMASAELTLAPERSVIGEWLARLRSTGTIIAVFLVSLVFVLGLVTLLDYFKFQSSLNDLAQRRIGIIIERVHRSLETAIDLGLNLRDIGVARTILGNTQAEDARIKNITIFSTDGGRVLFAADPASAGSAVSPTWLSAQEAAGDRVWRITSGDHILVGQRLDSAFAQAIGGVVLDYSVADVIARIARMRDNLIKWAVLTWLAFSVAALIGALTVTREFRKTVRGLAEAIGSGAPTVAGAIPDSLVASVDRFKRTTAEAESQLERFEDGLTPHPHATAAVDRPEAAA